MKRTKFKTGILAVVFCSLTFLFSGDGNSIYADEILTDTELPVGRFSFEEKTEEAKEKQESKEEKKEKEKAVKVAQKKFKELGEKAKKEELEVLKIKRKGEYYYYISAKDNTVEIRITDNKITRVNSVPVE